MTRKVRQDKHRPQQRLGDLTPQYGFFLNPYTNVRFTCSCPGCSGKSKQRKLPLAIHVDDWGIVILHDTCRFCPYCDLLIAHQDEIEANLAWLFAQVAPQLIRSDYLCVGTVERKVGRRGLTNPLDYAELFGALHDFKDHLHFEQAPRWEYVGHGDGPPRPSRRSTHTHDVKSKEDDNGNGQAETAKEATTPKIKGKSEKKGSEQAELK